MYKFRSKRKKSFVQRYGLSVSLVSLGVAAVSFGFVYPAASGFDSNSRVFAEGLKIHLDRSSPAFAALEDAWMPAAADATVDAELKRGQNVALVASSESAASIADRILKENRREQTLVAQERASREAMAQALAKAASDALKKMTEHLAPIPEPEEAPAKTAQKAEPESEDAKSISLSDLKINREELLASLFLPIANSGPAAQASAKNPFANVRLKNDGPAYSPEPEPSNTADVMEQSFGPAYSDGHQDYDDLPVQPTLRQVTVAGPVEFVDGLALAHAADRLVVFREVEGQPLESGNVWLREARYEIFVEENSGVLTGELRTPYGDVIGRGSLDLARVPIPKGGTRRTLSAALKIRPVAQGMTGRVLTRRSGEPRVLKGAQVAFRDLPLAASTRNDGRFQEPHLLEGSSAIVKVERPGYWGTMAFVRSSAANEIDIFTNEDVQMIRRLVSNSKTGAVVWGRVVKNGKPVAGAQVELMTTADVLQPIYFNALLQPDPKLRETSANGLYAFFPVPEGAHAVRAKAHRQSPTEPVIFPTEDRSVSHVDIEAASEQRARVRVFDAFETAQPLAGQVTSPGSETSLSVDGSGTSELKFTNGPGLAIFDVNSEEGFEVVRATINREKRVLYAPMIRSSWLEEIRAQMKLDKDPNAGTVVGFVQGANAYRASLEGVGLPQSAKVVYFNNRGEYYESEHGEPGGGFVIFNVPEGFRTITVQPSGTNKIFSSVTLIDRRVTNVISQWLK